MVDIEKRDLGIAPEAEASSRDRESPWNESQLGEKQRAEEASLNGRSSLSIAAPPTPRDEEENHETDPSPLQKVESSVSRAASIVPVPRKQRRGLFGFLTVIPEITVPTDYPNRTKWMLTILVALAGIGGPIGSAIILPALVDANQAFHSPATITNLNVALYMLSMAIFPLWWSSFSETFGRRSIYLVSFALFTFWGVFSAISTNIAMLIAMRVLSGGAAASVQAVGAGTISDLWESRERGKAMGIFYLGPLCGPLLAPIIGGALNEGLGWRSTQWFLVCYGAVTFTALLFFLPETLKRKQDVTVEVQQQTLERTMSKSNGNTGLGRVSTRQSVQVKTKKSLVLLRQCFIEPLSIILYLRYTAVLVTVAYASITFCVLYILNISVQATFSQPPYNFSSVIVGLMYVPNSLGYFITSIVGGRWIDYIMQREAKKAGRYDAKGRLILRPEDRMRENAWVAAIMFPCALIWYGWTAEKGVFWLAPAIANFFFGVGSMLIFAMVTTMLTEFLPKRASTGIALNNFVRNIFSCAGAVAAEPIISAIGNGWLFTIFGLICIIGGPLAVWAMRRWGAKWAREMNEKLN